MRHFSEANQFGLPALASTTAPAIHFGDVARRNFLTLHTDIPTRDQVDGLFTTHDEAAVSIYLPTEPSSPGHPEQIALKNLVTEALHQLQEAGTPRKDLLALEEELSDLIGDTEFWRFQARTLAVFATPTSMVTYRLPNRLLEMVAVADRFHLKPLLRSITFPQVALVLAFSQNTARLLEVLPDGGPREVSLPGLPSGFRESVRIVHVDDRSPRGKTQSSMAEKSHLRAYCRSIDSAIRSVLAGRDVPLILAVAEPLESIYRSINSYPHLAPKTLTGNPERTTDGELAERSRSILDELYDSYLVELHDLFDRRQSEGRAGMDVADTARAATYGMVDTLIVDIDSVIPGAIDDDGMVEFSDVDDAIAYGVVDEISRRVWLQGGRVLAVRRDQVPGGGDLAAILRYTF